MKALRTIYADAALRTAGLVLIFQGAIVCTFGPYYSTLAVNTYRFGDNGFAVLLTLSTLVAVSASVLVGIRTDQTANRRRVALGSVIALALGMGLMTLMPGRVSFVLMAALLFPVASSLFGQVFAMARLAARTYPPAERDAIQAAIRALFAAPFVVVLPLWSLAFDRGAPVLAVFPVGFAIALVMLAVVARYWPKDGNAGWQDAPSGLSFRAALREMSHGRIAGRVLALGAVNAAGTIYIALISLLMVAEVGRGPADVALYVGLVAGLEVPFMLMLPRFAAGRDRTVLIFAGAALYAVHVGLLPVLAGNPLVWLLVLPAAMGGAVTLTVPIAYLQDQMAHRPGTGSSLMAVQRLAGDVIAAGCFAAGTLLSGYGLVAVFGVLVSLLGAAALWRADRLPRR